MTPQTPTPLRFTCAEVEPDELFCAHCGNEPATRWAGAYQDDLCCDECGYWADFNAFGPGGRQ